jgi:phytoene synthase
LKKKFKNLDKNNSIFIKNHYENFPVASFLIPKYYRKDIAIVYWFARTADDIVDEGNYESEKRLELLNKFEADFKNSLKGIYDNFYFKILSKTIKENELTEINFLNLISAFRQDVIKKRYESYIEVLNYCARSANPVGRILLELFKVDSSETIIYSDNICTALQLTNFLQDTSIDFKKGRIYYPLDELRMFLATEKMFELNEKNPNIKALIKHNVDRTQVLFDQGKNLLKFLSGRFKFEIKWTISGGEKILSMIRKNDYDVFSKRPKLNKFNFIALFIKNVF